MEASGDAGAITLVETERATTVRLSGEVDASLREDADAAWDRVVQRELPVVIDCSTMTFIDSSGLGFIIRCGDRGRILDLPVVLVDPSALLLRMLQVLGVEQLFEVSESVEGLDRLSGPADWTG
jgi:anti-anti-sigma factor